MATVDAEYELAQSERLYDDALELFREANAKQAALSLEINELIRRLPPSEQDVAGKSTELSVLHRQVVTLDIELEEKRNIFSDFMDEVNVDLAQQKDEVIDAFNSFARDFLLEDCSLTWTLRPVTVGQEGIKISYASFVLELGGSDFDSPIRRSEFDQVSQSQQEFLELAYRMALMTVAAEGAETTLVLDAPETSLDGVFASRAAEVINMFSGSSDRTRVLVTSNLVDGSLIPELLQRSNIKSPENPRILNLLLVAQPTAAVRQRRKEYDALISKIFNRSLGR
jgi:hypothetical protein